MSKIESIAKSRAQDRVFIENIKHTGTFKKIFKTLIIMGFIGGMLIGLSAYGVYVYYSKDTKIIPSQSEYRPSITTKVYGGDRDLIGAYSTEFRDVVSYEMIPKLLIKAFIASEDVSFFDHDGLNYIGIFRAMIKNIKAGRIVQGGSSISQQTAKSFLTDKEKAKRNIGRKIKEVIMARQGEQIYNKEYLIYLYLNQIYLGHGAYGIQAASWHYFHKDVWELNLAEISLIAGLPQAPSDFSPYQNLPEAIKRRKYVLKRMFDEKFITQEELTQAMKRKIVVVRDIPSRYNYYVDQHKKHPNHVFIYDYGVRTDTLAGKKNLLVDSTYVKAPYFAEYAHKIVQQMVGEKNFYTQGYKIYTTMSPEKQYYGRNAVTRGLASLSSRQGFYGPVEHLEKIEYKKFLENSKQYYREEKPVVGKRYLGLLTDVTKKTAAVKFAGFEGKITIKNTRWARKENPLIYFGRALIRDLRKPLKTGDVVWIRIYEKEKRTKDGTLIVGLSQIPKPQGALLSVDQKTGYVRAMIGGREYSEFNRALQAERQSGSIFKPLYYSKALDEDYSLSTILYDTPIVEYDYNTKVNWKPANYEGKYQGEVTLRKALMLSMNVPSIKVFQHLGTEKVAEWVKKLGINSALNMDSSMALGSTAIKLSEITQAFSIFPNRGLKKPFIFIKKIVDRDGKIILNQTYFKDPFIRPEQLDDQMEVALFKEDKRIVDPITSFLTLRLLYAVARSGTAVATSRLRVPVYGKTGTTNDSFDTWFMGMTSSQLTGVWIGYDLNDNPLGRGEAGGKTALPVWMDYTKNALAYNIKHKKEVEFKAPAGVEWVKIDRDTGKKASKRSLAKITEAYRRGNEPEEDTRGNTVTTDDLLLENY